MVQCEKCGSKWEASSAYSKSLSACPFCGAMLLEEEKARGYGKMDEFLGYMVKVYGEELYRTPERLKNLIGDLYGGEERVKRLFRRALVEEKLSVKVYEIAQKPKNERLPFYNRLASQFAEGNYFPLELSLKVVGSLVSGLTGEVLDGKEFSCTVIEAKNSPLRMVFGRARRGDPWAQLMVGMCYYEGIEVEKDYGKAVEWFLKAAKQGETVAQTLLGECYKCGRGVEEDEEKAVEWYSKAAESGYAQAQYELGFYYFRRGGEEDGEKVIDWYRKAAEQGNSAAQCELGWLIDINFIGLCGINGTTAFHWYSKAAEQGNSAAQYKLGLFYESRGAYANAVECYRAAAEQDDSNAQYAMGCCYRYGLGVEKDMTQAEKWFQKAYAQGNDGRCYCDSIDFLIDKNLWRN